MSKLLAGALTGIIFLAAAGSASAACTATGYMKDGNDLTAALINPGNVSGQIVDATGCDIGVYYGPGNSGNVRNGSEIFGAKYFGVLTNGALASVTDSSIHDIGQVPFLGAQLGYGIGCAVDSPQASGGDIRGNVIYNYQKSGIDIRGENCGGTSGAPIRIYSNQVTGWGPTDGIAQNGIVVIGASYVTITGNNVSGHRYTGSQVAASAALNILGGACFNVPQLTHSVLDDNRLLNNDVGIFLLNFTSGCSVAPGVTGNNTISNNGIFNYSVLNTSGYETGPYQIGISITDTSTMITENNICGSGYDKANQPSGGLVGYFDKAGSRTLVLKHNGCFDPQVPVPDASPAARNAVEAPASLTAKKPQSRP